jgi:hypothetical protein
MERLLKKNEHIPGYVELLDSWLERMQKGVQKEQLLF